MQWIDLKERWPDDSERNVLMWNDSLKKVVMQNITGGIQPELTHWMHLPDAPVASNKEFKATKAP